MVSDNITAQNCDLSYPNQPGYWVTKDYLQDILKNYTKDDTLNISKLKFSSVTAIGESYGGVITRAHIGYHNNQSNLNLQSINLVIKTAFNDDKFAMDVLKDFDVFNREMNIYSEILPKLNKLLKEVDLDEVLFADAIHIDYKNYTMIFEDLCAKNFQTVNRLNGLDFNHAKISLRKLAKMHAAGAVLQQRSPHIFQTGYNNGFFTRETDAYNNYFVTILKACIQVIYEDFDNNYHIYAEKINLLLKNLIELGRKCFDPTPDQFNTFIHGDIWTSNLMFQYTADKSNILDAVLIDFQFSCWSSATIDLQYFLNIALSEDLKRNSKEDLLKFYYEIFSTTLTALNFNEKIPNLNEFYLNFLKKDFYGFIVTCVNQPIALNESPEIDFHACHGTDERAMQCKKLMFKNKKIQDNLKYWLPIFDRLGLLDMTA